MLKKLSKLTRLAEWVTLSDKELAVGQLIKSNILFNSDPPKDHFGSVYMHAHKHTDIIACATILLKDASEKSKLSGKMPI